MKFLPIVLTVLASLIPSCMALCDISWNIPDVPSEGLTDITFPINIANAPHTAGYYFAQQFGFVGLADVGYIGLQPRPDSDSGSTMHGVFSSFVSGATSTDDNCSNGADGGDGVSCAVDFLASYSDTWNLVVTSDGNTWSGAAVDSSSGVQQNIGTYTLPAGAGGIQSSQVGFVEYYPWNGNSTFTCADLPSTKGTFYPPTTQSSSNGAVTGDISGSVDNCQSYITQQSISGGVDFSIS
ncbi:uncharacterized protein TRUGW13939_04801 [Talaromyces rugulosus]|uniref:Uncharacterized protein n=1 Tax=Talaromyces rugulosus TaxID=121627 RepID=A0A7H8QY51_TALRU|nr:uncharacterized protein TRUGW13939_04801 [Talaromyces rugulosus]QKX57683.1 hypothetical protein TRUGW13939_04801 [Talaromyces rugulosus]